MSRKRLTQIFPFLLPLRRWQRKKLFYIRMRFDGNRYSKEIRNDILPQEVFGTSSLMLNKNSGFDMKYQQNKVFNLKLAAKTLNQVVIKPSETFSFWQLARYADKRERYKDGLNLIDGKIVGSYGGGLCQISNMLFWMFLHTPLEIVERHGHAVESFPSTTESNPCGTDATINEGWLDLKVRNNTNASYQIVIRFDEEFMYGWIYSDKKQEYEYRIYNSDVKYQRKKGKIYQTSVVNCLRTRISTDITEQLELYTNICEIGYELPNNINIEEID